MHSDIRTVEYLLTQWGRWAYANRGVQVNFPSVSPMFKSATKSPMSPNISDEDAIVVDGVVSQLRNRQPKMWEALGRYYIAGQSYRTIAKELDTHHRVASDLVNGGKMWVEGAIFGFSDQSEY